MTWLTKLLPRLKVLLTAAPTWLMVAAAAVTALSDPIAEALPKPWSEQVTAWAISILAVLTAATLVVRNLTKVFGPYVGLLAPTPPPSAVGAGDHVADPNPDV